MNRTVFMADAPPIPPFDLLAWYNACLFHDGDPRGLELVEIHPTHFPESGVQRMATEDPSDDNNLGPDDPTEESTPIPMIVLPRDEPPQQDEDGDDGHMDRFDNSALPGDGIVIGNYNVNGHRSTSYGMVDGDEHVY